MVNCWDIFIVWDLGGRMAQLVALGACEYRSNTESYFSPEVLLSVVRFLAASMLLIYRDPQ
jgi:hypothetical protein